MRIILASQSPRRRELMQRAGYEFEVLPSQGEEVVTKTIPAEVVEELSFQKAEEVAKRVAEENGSTPFVVIGADTIVAAEGKILGKPADQDQAYKMIEMIQGKAHQVYTGVTLMYFDEEQKIHTRTFHECTDVDVYPMTNSEIEHYVSTKEPYDKAGAYGIQGTFGVFIQGIRGDYNNVVGLPIARLYHELEDFLKEWNQ